MHWAERRGGYLRKLTPLLDRFEPGAPEIVPPPHELIPTRPDAGTTTIDRLRAWRDEAARGIGALPEALVSDRILTTIAERRPATPDDLDRMTGLGAITSRRLFDGITTALDEHETTRSG